MTSRSQSPVFGIGKNGDIQDEMGNLEEPSIETFSPAFLYLLSSVWKSCLLKGDSAAVPCIGLDLQLWLSIPLNWESFTE